MLGVEGMLEPEVAVSLLAEVVVPTREAEQQPVVHRIEGLVEEALPRRVLHDAPGCLLSQSEHLDEEVAVSTPEDAVRRLHSIERAVLERRSQGRGDPLPDPGRVAEHLVVQPLSVCYGGDVQ